MIASWQESYEKPRQCVKKQRHHFANKGMVKVMVFPLVMYRYKSWTIKKAQWLRMKVAQSCPTLCDPMDYTFHGILQDRILEWVAVPFSKGSSQPRDRTLVSSIAGRFFTSWATREAQRGRIDAFEMWCCRRLLRVPWTVRRSNQSILQEIKPDYSLEGLMLKLKLQYSGHLMRRANSLEKTLMLGKIESRRRRGDRGWDGWMASPIQWTWVWENSGRWWGTGKPGVLQSIGSQKVGHDLATAKQTYKVWNCSPRRSSRNDQQVASDSHNPARRTSRLTKYQIPNQNLLRQSRGILFPRVMVFFSLHVNPHETMAHLTPRAKVMLTL